MKGLALAAAGAAIVGMTACSHSDAPQAAAPTNHGGATPIVPVSCGKQYRNWAHGEGKGLMTALDAVISAAGPKDAHQLTAALKHARPALSRATRHPIPACADPRDYWSVLLMHVNAAAAGTGRASSVRAAMRDVPKIHHKLVVEVKQTAE